MLIRTSAELTLFILYVQYTMYKRQEKSQNRIKSNVFIYLLFYSKQVFIMNLIYVYRHFKID